MLGDLWDGLRHIILFVLGALCIVGALTEDPIHLWSLIIGLLLMGVITIDQVKSWFDRNEVVAPPSPPTKEMP